MVLWPIRARVPFELFYKKTFLTDSQPGYVLSVFSNFWLKKADRKRKKIVESYHVTQQGAPDTNQSEEPIAK